jgi:molybdate transport system ATP-binding protein
LSVPALQVQVSKGHGAARAARDARGARDSRDSRDSNTAHDAGIARFRLETEFETQPGVTVLVGPSGAGKSTLLRCIAGLSKPDQGRIAIGGRIVFDAAKRVDVPPEHRQVAFVFQDLALFPHLTVRENVVYGLRRLDARERERRRAGIMAAFQIEHLQHRLPRDTSGGEQQRVALARSLVTEPSVLLLDEPLTSLDRYLKAAIIDDLLRWNQARRIPIVYVTHDRDEMLALGDRIIALSQGRIAADGMPLDVVPALRQEAVAQPGGCENLLDAVVVAAHEAEGTMRCRVAGIAGDLEVPLTRVAAGATVRVGIRAGDILLASARPAILGPCNVIRGRVQSRGRTLVEIRADGGAELLVHLPAAAGAPAGLEVGAEAWMIVRSHACHLVRTPALGPVQRLFVFVCSGNTSRSPMAQAICNAEVARRLKVPPEALGAAGVRALSAGLAATPGMPMTGAAQQALSRLGVPVFEHRSQNLTAELVTSAEAIFCMTTRLRDLATAAFPGAAAKIALLPPSGMELEEPAGGGADAFANLARQIQACVRQRLDTLVGAPE